MKTSAEITPKHIVLLIFCKQELEITPFFINSVSNVSAERVAMWYRSTLATKTTTI